MTATVDQLERRTRLQEIAAAELRGRATPEERGRLEADLATWVESLEKVIADIEAQIERRAAQYRERADVESAAREFDEWVHRARTFQAMAIRRLGDLQETERWARRCQEDQGLADLEATCRQVVAGHAPPEAIRDALAQLDRARASSQPAYAHA